MNQYYCMYCFSLAALYRLTCICGKDKWCSKLSLPSIGIHYSENNINIANETE